MFRLLSILFVVTLGSGALAQSRPSQPAAAADPIAALTAELRALRAEIAETARANLRLQLLVARLQLQEQRIIYLDRQRSDLSSRVAGVQQQRMALEGAVKMFGDADATNEMAKGIKAQLAIQQTSEQQLRAEETQVLNSMATEQAQWSDLSGRLEELERSLSQR
jgi:hypothetical protein